MKRTATPAEGVVAIGASAGGIEALCELAAGMPADFPFAVMIVIHMSRGAPSLLAQIIGRCGPLPAVAAVDGAVLEAGRIYAAVPDHHLLARDHRIALSDGPWESGRRPGIDALFRSVALDYGPRAIGVLMSGLLDDGVAGLRAIKAKGGVTVVQEPADALFPDLPNNAMKASVADHTAAAKDIGSLLAELAGRNIEEPAADPDGRLELENQIAMDSQFAAAVGMEDLGPPTGYTCPSCNGALMAVADNGYRCQVGHAWTAQALLVAYGDELEEAVWAAIRTLKDTARLSRTLAENAESAVDLEGYTAAANQAAHAIAALRQGLLAAKAGNNGTTEASS
ncbi:chemotaxis protein CheB [Mycobacterium sp. E2497]|uniref:chemotaxis protein CheB n=1 Tax=Mycobacterium sp. E2497 TaxID=1834135 RepID=UPI0007FEFAF9|nr:chemotaxis protein CheB [Mycobacterium sp. E2497]OBI19095.1 protein-glutamate methylesterase [Mycobacterium sp. E2497]